MPRSVDRGRALVQQSEAAPTLLRMSPLSPMTFCELMALLERATATTRLQLTLACQAPSPPLTRT